MESGLAFVLLFLLTGIVLGWLFCRKPTLAGGVFYTLIEMGIQFVLMGAGVVIAGFAIMGFWPYVLAWQARQPADLVEHLGPLQENFTISRSVLNLPDKPYTADQYRFSLDIDGPRRPYFFAAKQYTLPAAEMPAINAGLCREIKAADKPVPELLKLGSLKYSAKSNNPGPVAELLLELLVLLDQSIAVMQRPFVIGVRGYADGQYSEWTEILRYKPSHYRKLSVLRPDTPAASAYSLDTVARRYSNADLPNLRAQFIRREIIAPYLKTCHAIENPDIRIFDGDTYEFIDSSQRKAELYLFLY